MKGWVNEAKAMAIKDGVVDLQYYNVNDLSIMPVLPSMHTLNISYNSIYSLYKLKDQLGIRKFIADNTQINSLSGFLSIRNATNISLKNTPVSFQENIIISLLIVCPNLVVYNGHAIPKKYREYAKTVPKQAYKLINAGLQINYPVENEKIQMEISRFNLDELYNFEAVDSESSANFPPYIRNKPDDERRIYSIFSQASPKYRKYFRTPVSHKQESNNASKKKITRIQSQKLLKSVKNILENSGFDIHQNSKTSSVLIKLSELLNAGKNHFDFAISD